MKAQTLFLIFNSYKISNKIILTLFINTYKICYQYMINICRQWDIISSYMTVFGFLAHSKHFYRVIANSSANSILFRWSKARWERNSSKFCFSCSPVRSLAYPSKAFDESMLLYSALREVSLAAGIPDAPFPYHDVSTFIRSYFS